MGLMGDLIVGSTIMKMSMIGDHRLTGCFPVRYRVFLFQL